MIIVGDSVICSDCIESYYTRCDCCDEWVSRAEAHCAIDSNGYEVTVCDYCLDRHFVCCDDCGEMCHVDGLVAVYDERGGAMTVGQCCAENYEECSECRRHFHRDVLIDGLCPDCAAKKEEDAE